MVILSLCCHVIYPRLWVQSFIVHSFLLIIITAVILMQYSALFSSVQHAVTQRWSVHSALSLLISADKHWVMLSGAIAELVSSQNGWGRRNSNSDQCWSEKSSCHSALIRTCGAQTKPQICASKNGPIHRPCIVICLLIPSCLNSLFWIFQLLRLL